MMMLVKLLMMKMIAKKEVRFKRMMMTMKIDSYVELPRRFINWGLRVDPEQNPVQKSTKQQQKYQNW